MRMVDLIEKKRDGGILTDDEIRFIIQGLTDDCRPDRCNDALGRYGGLEPVRR